MKMESYGTTDKTKAERLAERLRILEPENRFEVAQHTTGRTGEPAEYVTCFSVTVQTKLAVTPIPATWGVVRYIPYTEEFPWRLTGFVWWDYSRIN